MMLFSSTLVFTLLQVACTSYLPQHVHLAYGENPHEIVVTWTTQKNTGTSVVEYGINGLVKQAYSRPTLFQNPPEKGKPPKQMYIHRVKLRKLEPDSKYSYHVGSSQAWSNEFWFVTPPAEGEPWGPQLAIYGDLGNENSVSLPRLQKETQRGLYDAILHVGDFAYDLDLEQGNYADEFLEAIQPIAAYAPYMVTPGNHEEAYNFTHYRVLFSMPGNSENLMYSYNMGPAHFISISTELYYFLQYGIKPLANQYAWLEQDLKEATSDANRTKHPWIIVLGHRPMYCSNQNLDDCTYHQTRTRIGLPIVGWFGLEALFCKYGVDLMIWAHEHDYERLWPIYNYQVYNGSYEDPYHNPNAPVHVITGSAGCRENHDHFRLLTPSWSAFHSTDYGFMRMKIFNSSHLYMEQISEDLEGQVIDHMWLIKDYHIPYYHCSKKGQT